jgi:PAS domain S-box-containing protein
MAPESSALRSADLLLVGDSPWVDNLADTLERCTGTAVRVTRGEAAALETFHERRPDAVLTEYELEGGTGLDLLRSVRDHVTTVPVLLATVSGDEELASEAIAAGVTDYVPVDAAAAGADELLERTERAVREARRGHTQRDRARQFDAIFHDARTATWVLDTDGSVARVNQTARELAGTDAGALVDEPFWTLPYWAESDRIQADVRRVVETALDGQFGNAVVVRDPDEDVEVLELSARPVTNERGDLVSVVVDGTDITDHADLERDLRQSEKLHRVTLNNMTDTVLITDEAGEYTYVCPNVHFIFGYTAEEIRDLGTIDELLGADLFDREALAEDGVLKNIECTVTDKAGREHTLLVNVREVSIQDGTLLYSCRDITKRKQREQALATLQETARDFLYAETDEEIARHVTDDTADVLDLDASAVYRFDTDENALQPIAATPEMADVHGPLPPVHADSETLPGYSFVEDEPLFFDDVHRTDELGNRATDLRSAAYIPLGNHGVFVAGSTSVDVFDEVTRELADLLAATAEAAFDRVRREAQLREQDRELQRQNDQLTTVNRINETIREIDQALVRAETREEIEHTVCDRLTADDRFSFAWIGSMDAAGKTVTPDAWAGAERGYLDGQSFAISETGVEPAGRTAATGELTMVANVPGALREEAWRKDALSRDYLSVVSVPLVYNDLSYGVLTVYAEVQDAFKPLIRDVFEELGKTIASAISANERKQALLTTSITRAGFGVEDSSFLLSRLARDASCTVSYQGGARQTADGSYVFVEVADAPVEVAANAARDLVVVDSVQEIAARESGGILRLRLSRSFVAQELADHGVLFHGASATPESTSLVVDIPESVDAALVRTLLEDAFDDIELVSKRTRDQAAEHSVGSRLFEALTDRQLEVVQTAYYSGFFESPRECSGEEIADVLGISPSAFYQHSRAVQRTLFSTLFDEEPLDATASAD